MQNILGANNVLVPPEAPFEEILQAILYNTPYTKEAEARIEDILLAIKNNGTYDGEPQSRDEEILISKLNQTPYTKDAESRIEELFILWAAQSVIKQLEGVPPLTFTAQGQPLINWTIYGASGGVGDKTGNLFDTFDIVRQVPSISSGALVNSVSGGCTSLIPISSAEITMAITNGTAQNNYYLFLYDDNENYIGYRQIVITSEGTVVSTEISGYSSAKYARIRVDNLNTHTTDNFRIMLAYGTTAQSFEPYGYKIQILCGGETNTIYFDTPLYDGDSISMADTGIEILTINGQNTLAVDTTVQPEKIYIEYK